MPITYSVNFKKFNRYGKQMLCKEGEIILNRNSLRLRGKGANDQGENINFVSIKDIKIEKHSMEFVTFKRDNYLLSKMGSDFEGFLEDFYRIKNEFFIDNTFMKGGMFIKQFDCSVEIAEGFENYTSKGKATLEFYEKSIVIRPKLSDAISIDLNFLKQHQFDQNEYHFLLESENGMKIRVNKLGSNFEEVEEITEGILEKMYQKVLNGLNCEIPGFSLTSLLKVACLIKEGKCVSIPTLKKIDPALSPRMMEVIFQDNHELEQKVQHMRNIDPEAFLLLGISFSANQNSKESKHKKWFACALPSLNMIAFGLANNPSNKKIIFLRISNDGENQEESLNQKIMEINKCLIHFDFDFTPFTQELNELRSGKYKTALMRMNCLKNCRRSLIGVANAVTLDAFKAEIDKFKTIARQKPVFFYSGKRFFKKPFNKK